MYYITIQNENYLMPNMPQGCEEGIMRGMYRINSVDAGSHRPRVQLFGSGSILREALRAQKILAEKYEISSTAWSVTSYKTLRTEAQAARRWNMLHPEETPRKSYLEEVISGEEGPFIATSDNVRAVAEQIDPWLPGGIFALGTDGLGRSDQRENLRRHFEIDAETVAVAALYNLALRGQIDKSLVAQSIRDLGVDREKVDPWIA
jgi:pyruvate dehydrogenase E1 component